jgi:crotonobetainyl-CoA:carnitine CoA-transferase CaiB-like acyl-CoA transferase
VHPSIAPYQPLRVQDGWLTVAAANDGLFARLCEVLGRADLLDDPRFATNADRVAHRAELVDLLELTLVTRPAEEWLERLTAAGVPAGKIRGVGEAFAAAAAAGEPATLRVDHPTLGAIELVRTAPRFDAARQTPPAPPPRLGEHTRAVLLEAGLDDAEIDALLGR